jgi:hypothetical protein
MGAGVFLAKQPHRHRHRHRQRVRVRVRVRVQSCKACGRCPEGAARLLNNPTAIHYYLKAPYTSSLRPQTLVAQGPIH